MYICNVRIVSNLCCRDVSIVDKKDILDKTNIKQYIKTNKTKYKTK